MAAGKRAAPPPPPTPSGWALRLARNAVLWLLPVTLLWVLLTPVYNRILLNSASGLLHLVERPPVTDLPPKGDHDAFVIRRDFPPARAVIYRFRVTDLHFHLLLLGALFLAVPGLPWRERLRNLAWAALFTVCYDVLLVVFVVEFTYATQLGPWSLAHYGAVTRNLFGLGKHLLDLPFKLALPLLLWSAFYFRLLRAGAAGAANAEPSRP